MQIKNELPPVWDNACAAFQVNPKHTVFTYGNTIYNPGGGVVSEDVIAHEETHAAQQQHSEAEAALWWGKYLRDPAFRLDQEARAYGKQFKFICTRNRDRNKRVRVLYDLARVLSGPLYGSMLPHAEAVKLIQKYAL